MALRCVSDSSKGPWVIVGDCGRRKHILVECGLWLWFLAAHLVRARQSLDIVRGQLGERCKAYALLLRRRCRVPVFGRLVC